MIPRLRLLYSLYTNPKGALIRNTLAFSTLMSLAPTIALLTIASLIVLKDTTTLQNQLSTVLPQQVVQVLVEVGATSASGGFFPFMMFIGLAIFTASRGFYATILAFQVFDDNTKPNSFWLTVQSLVATVLFIVLIVLVISSNMVLHLLFPELSFFLNALISLFFFHIIGAAFLILTSSPLKSYLEIMYGAWTFAIGITLMGTLFFFYIYRFTNYQDVYGPIAGLLIVILSMYWISCLIFFCFCVNEWIRQGKEEQQTSE